MAAMSVIAVTAEASSSPDWRDGTVGAETDRAGPRRPIHAPGA